MNTIKVAVLMTCYNRVETTLRCLEGLFAQDIDANTNLDVWLVDDASPDGTGRIVKEHFPNVNVITSKGNLFWSKGMHTAWSAAVCNYDYDYYLWLNDDVLLANDSVASLIDDALNTAGEKRVAVGTFLQSSDSDKISYGCCKSKNVLLVPSGKPQIATGCMFTGNMVLVPKIVYKKIGMISGSYTHACGDSDYCMRLRRSGLEYVCSSKMSGICPQQPERYIQLGGMTLKKRLKALFSPKGLAIHDAVLYRYRFWGLWRAILTAAHLVSIALFPSLDKRFIKR